ncbi:MAG: hypothetical protein A3F13_05770 [Gammaproteobacteria bacterium RIFCSPHIGHO2_12_FULL_40_19]|nr:MAG: hypothetical protein A3F13_05770 [Gammaproteobacteria bacterium RIFCSPHIGHO2_12_FULL_40_19]
MVNKVRKTEQKRRRFSRDFKLDAIKLAKESGQTPCEVNENLGLSPQMVERWLKEYERDEMNAFPRIDFSF